MTEMDEPHLDLESDCAWEALVYSSGPRPRAGLYDRLDRDDDELGRPQLEDKKQNGLWVELQDVEPENQNVELGQTWTERGSADC